VSELDPGAIVDGRYKVISRLGAGGMADVFLVEDTQLSRRVALKLLHRRFSADPAFVERFRREAQSAASLQHPNVVGVYDRGAWDGTYYIAMEYLPGRSLKQLIRQEAPLDPLRAIDITLQILKAARFAHRRGVIHRDLKPHNVIVDENDQAKVTDFGIARAGASDMTETGSIMGTAQYLSPEQAQGHAVSETSDLYSVGIVLYEMLTGRVPFDAESAVTIALKHVSEAPPLPSRINPSIPPALEQAVLWSLNKNPADRPADADQFISVLEQVRDQIVSGSKGEITASMKAVAAVGPGPRGPGGAGGPADLGGPPPTALMPAADAITAYTSSMPTSPGGRNGHNADDHGGGARVWPWVLAVVIVLLLAGGGVTAYLLTRPHKASVPVVVNEQLSIAQAAVQNAGFTPNVIYETSSEPANTVIEQSPLGESRVDTGTVVTLTVSNGPGEVSVPAVDQLSQKAASQAINRAGLKVTRVLTENSNAVATGDATRTDPPAGDLLQQGSGVTLYISSGKANVTVPQVTGDTEQAAKNTLTNAGFTVTTVNQAATSSQAVGTVISQSPSSGSLAPGSAVTITIATAPTTASVPSVVGDTAAGATTSLTGAGFTVTKKTQKVTVQSENGNVISQTPAANATANKGSAVTIVVGKYKGGSTTTTTTTPTTTTATTTTPTTTGTTASQ
jgi:eukaryotic-like serine/threonine-protein kinase